jgi:site-specific DNA-methyltransferase (adenine-specific)
MKVEQLKLSDIKPYDRNPRKNDRAVETVMTSIKEFGFQQPIVVDKNNVIVVGHTRFRAAKKLNLKTVPVLIANQLNEDQIRAYRIMDNKSNEFAEWDLDLLLAEMKELDGRIDMMLTGFREDEFQYMSDDSMRTEDEKDNSTPPLTTGDVITEQGDIWHLGDHRVICGSSTDPKVWASLMLDKTARLVFTSPPYNMGAKLYDEYSDDKGSEEYIQFNLDVIDCALKHLQGFIFWNISYNKNSRSEFIDVLYQIKKKAKFLELICWKKNSAIVQGSSLDSLTRGYEDIAVYSTDDCYEDLDWISINTNVKNYNYNRKFKNKITNFWEIDNKNVQEDNHRAAFPVELPGRGIKMVTKNGDIVVDPFGGTGTTLIACEKYNRVGYLIELSPVYCDMIIQRWCDYTGKEAIRLQDGKKFNE